MKNIILALVVVLVLGFIVYRYTRPQVATIPGQPSVAGESTALTPTLTVQEQQATPTEDTSVSPVINVSFKVSASNFSFDLPQMKVKKGDRVKIDFTNFDGYHDFRLDEFNVAIPALSAGQTESATFIADKTGTFEYYCSVDSHRQKGMVGQLIVE